MGSIEDFTVEKLISGILTSRPTDLEAIKEALTAEFGRIDYQSDLIPFRYTPYYDREMGTPIYRCFFSFQDLVLPDALSDVKRITNDIERRFSLDGMRKANIDPGLVSLQRLILASTKDNGRRVPLSKGIYAEITLVFIEQDFRHLDWTYPDYRSREYKEIFKDIREIYRAQLKQIR